MPSRRSNPPCARSKPSCARSVSARPRAAAEEIGLSPSALSRRITNLEEFVGKKLFTRARQSMQLTDEGQAFYEAVNPHLESLARAVEKASRTIIALLRLRLGVLPMFGQPATVPAAGRTAQAPPPAAYRHRHGPASGRPGGRHAGCRDHPVARTGQRAARGAAGSQPCPCDLQQGSGRAPSGRKSHPKACRSRPS